MLRKLSGFILLTASVCSAAVAQQTPAPNEKAQRLIGTIFEGGSYLGVQTQEVTKDNFARFGLREVRGVAVEKVVENSPAAQSGLQNGDVIVRFNGEEITSTRKLTRLISEVAPDHKASVTVLRNGSEREFSVTLGKRELPKFEMSGMNFENLPQLPAVPPVPMAPRAPLPPMRGGESGAFVWRTGENRQIGIGVTSLTKQLGDYFGVAEGTGLLVDNVRADSPAAKAGLKAGDVITEVEGREVKNSLDLIRAINENKEGEISLTIIRDRNRQTIRVTPETVKGSAAPYFQGLENFGEGTLPQIEFQSPVPPVQLGVPRMPGVPGVPSAPRAPIFWPRIL